MWQFFKFVALLIVFLFLYNLNKRLDARGEDVRDPPVATVPASQPQGASEVRQRESMR